MATFKKILTATAAIALLAGPASAWTIASEVVDATQVDESIAKYSNNWVLMQADRGDTRWGVYGNNVASNPAAIAYIKSNVGRYRPAAAGDKKIVDTDADFGPFEGDTYLMPLDALPVDSAVWPVLKRAGLDLQPVSELTRKGESTAQKEPPVPLVELVSGLSDSQAQMAKELSELSKNFGSLAVSDIDGLGETLSVLGVQAAENSALSSTVQELEAAYVALQNGQLTSGLLSAMQTEVDTTLQSVLGDISALQQADTAINNRLDSIQEIATAAATSADQALVTATQTATDLATLNEQLPGQIKTAAEQAVKTANAPVVFWTSNTGLGIFGGLLLLLGVIVYFAARRGVKATSDNLVELKTTVQAQAEKLAETHKVATSSQAQAVATHSDLRDFKEDVATWTKINPADISWDEDNLSSSELAGMIEEDGKVQIRLYFQGKQYSFNAWRDEDTPQGQVQTDIVRNVQSQQLADTMSVKRLQTRVLAAIADGRLTPKVHLHAVAAE